MITFEPHDLPGMYLKALQPRKEKELDEELASLTGEEKLKTLIGQRSLNDKIFIDETIPLLPPLKKILIRLSSNGQYYMGKALIPNVSLNKTFAESLEFTKSLGNKILDRFENEFVRMGNSGLFLNGGKRVLFAIKEDITDNVLYFGKDGTEKRRLSGFEHFETDITRFAEILSRTVNYCYDSPTPDITFSF